jgi:hypothetical protein
VYAQGLEASVRAPGARTKEEPFDQAEHQQDDLIGVQRPPEDAQAAAGSDADVDKAPPLSQWPEFLNMEHFSQEAQQQDYYINTSWWDASQDTVL